MAKFLLSLILILFFTLPLFGQGGYTAWVRRYDGGMNRYDGANDLAVNGSGNIYLTGESVVAGTSDYLTIKYYPNGDTAWVRSYNGPANDHDEAYDLAIDSSGNVYVTGYCDGGSGTRSNYATIKYYPNGVTAWAKIYNGPADDWDVGEVVAVDSYRNVYVSGWSTGNGTGYDYATLKYDSSGNELWVRRYHGFEDGNDKAFDMVVDSSGNAYVTGMSYGGETYMDYVTIRYYPDGETAWVRRYNGPGNDMAYAIAIDGSSNVCVTGIPATVKYDQYGNELWARTGVTAFDMAVDGSNNIYVTGETLTFETSFDYHTVKYDPWGNQLWTRTYDGPYYADHATAVAVDDSGNVYVSGSSVDSLTAADYATIKYYPDGTLAWIRRYNGTGNSFDLAFAIAVDNPGNVYITGHSLGSVTAYDYATIKYVPFLRGDFNDDMQVNVTDLIYLINYLFKNGPSPDPLADGDVNCDDKVSVSDVIYLVNYLFKGGPLPVC